MLNILSSTAGDKSTEFKKESRSDGVKNVEWLTQHYCSQENEVSLLLLGGTDSYAFRLRVAQSHVRHDMTPSHWSHVGILKPTCEMSDGCVDSKLVEISLQPQGGFGFPASTNGVQECDLGFYDDEVAFPNLALLRVPVAWNAVEKTMKEFKKQRAVLDAKELILHWLAYVWGVGRAANPLLDGHGFPSAAMVETVIGAAGYTLTPGLDSGASCPEAIWQSALWWHKYYQGQSNRPIAGSWTVEHRLGQPKSPTGSSSP